MNQSAAKALRYLTKEKRSESVSVEQLQHLVSEYPYFPVANFLLSQKLKSANSNNFIAQSQKTILFYANPLLLNLKLNQQEDFILDDEDELFKEIEEPTPEIGQSSEHTANDSIITNPVTDPAEMVTEVIEEMAGVSRETDALTEAFLQEINNTEPKKEDKQVEHSKNEIPEVIDEHERMFRNIKAMLDDSANEADADVENAEIPMDPYYTIDYFASQGIKLDLDQSPGPIGQKLKKVYPMVEAYEKAWAGRCNRRNRDRETEADIQKIADSSNTVKEVVTEAMASVLEKQGKKDKAIELYTKLSFLNPDKSTYFADKIKYIKR